MLHFWVTMSEFSATEKLLFAVLLAASIAGFSVRFVPIVRKIRSAKPDADFSLRPVGPRIRELLWEVALQAKVIRQRPLPGIAHALVFWGFCAFALVTLNHIAIGFGTRLLSSDSLYLLLAAIFAVLVAISISGLFVRRFILRPKWLGDLSYESGVIAV